MCKTIPCSFVPGCNIVSLLKYSILPFLKHVPLLLLALGTKGVQLQCLLRGPYHRDSYAPYLEFQ